MRRSTVCTVLETRSFWWRHFETAHPGGGGKGHPPLPMPLRKRNRSRKQKDTSVQKQKTTQIPITRFLQSFPKRPPQDVDTTVVASSGPREGVHDGPGHNTVKLNIVCSKQNTQYFCSLCLMSGVLCERENDPTCTLVSRSKMQGSCSDRPSSHSPRRIQLIPTSVLHRFLVSNARPTPFLHKFLRDMVKVQVADKETASTDGPCFLVCSHCNSWLRRQGHRSGVLFPMDRLVLSTLFPGTYKPPEVRAVCRIIRALRLDASSETATSDTPFWAIGQILPPYVLGLLRRHRETLLRSQCLVSDIAVCTWHDLGCPNILPNGLFAKHVRGTSQY